MLTLTKKFFPKIFPLKNQHSFILMIKLSATFHPNLIGYNLALIVFLGAREAPGMTQRRPRAPTRIQEYTWQVMTMTDVKKPKENVRKK